MLNLIGGWGNRPDTLQSSAERVQRSWRPFPTEPDAYGPWVFRRWDATSSRSLVTAVDTEDLAAIENDIAWQTEMMHGEPKTSPGFHIQFNRASRIEVYPQKDGEYAAECKYIVRSGFVDRPKPHNHVVLELNSVSEPLRIRNYLTALVQAWQPDHLAVMAQGSSKAQGHKPPQARVGWMTYLRDDIPLDADVLGKEISIAEADGGRYLQLPGTPDDPDMDSVSTVRKALGYPTA